MITLPDDFFFIAHTTLRCNYKCPFCIQRHEEDSRKKIFGFDEITTQQWIDGINHFKAPFCVLSGGEITVRKDAATIAIGIADNFGFVELGTNLSKDPTPLINEIVASGKTNIVFGVSYHPGQVRNDRQFLKWIKIILKSPLKLHVVSIIDIPDGSGKIASDRLKKMGVPKINLAPFEGFWNTKTKKYHTDDGEFYPDWHNFGEAGNRKKKELVSCRTTLIAISPNGSIHRCSHLLYINSKNNMGTVLDIDEEKIQKEIDEGVMCGLFGQCQPCNISRLYVKRTSKDENGKLLKDSDGKVITSSQEERF